MITNNLISVLTRNLTNQNSSVYYTKTNGKAEADTVAQHFGKALYYTTLTDESNCLATKLISGYTDSGILALGTGQTVATPEDYDLEEIITDYEVVSQSARLMFGDSPSSTAYTISRTIKNTKEEELTVSEIGLMVHSDYNDYLLAREVLNPGVTINPGEKHTFTLTISAD